MLSVCRQGLFFIRGKSLQSAGGRAPGVTGHLNAPGRPLAGYDQNQCRPGGSNHASKRTEIGFAKENDRVRRANREPKLHEWVARTKRDSNYLDRRMGESGMIA